MKENKISINIYEYDEGEQLPPEEQLLLNQAQKAIQTSYAPYSLFRVGAAVLLENGEIIIGSNQENTAYPSGLCAERVAIFNAKVKYPNMAIKAIAITAQTNNFEINTPISPCGGCRQVMAETEKRQQGKIKVIMKGHTGPTLRVDGIDSLLPLMFHEEKLKK